MSDLPGAFLSYVLLYKYAALFVLTFSAAVILPLPGNAILLAVGAFSAQGYFNFWFSLAAAVSANTLGDLFDYFVARKYGEIIMRALRMDKSRFFGRLSEELKTDAAATVFITRFAGSLSPLAALLSGLARVRFQTFVVYDFLGNFIEPAAALFIGYLAGDYWDKFSGILEIFAAIAAIGAILFVLIRIHGRIMRKYAGAD